MKNTAEKLKNLELFYKANGIKYGEHNHTATL